MMNDRLFCSLLILLVCFFGADVAQSQEFTEEQQAEALELIGKLESESFAGRESAMAALEELPASAAPWLSEMLELTGQKDIDLRSRLKSIIRSLRKREAEVSLTEGTQVKIDLEAARPEDVLAALEEATGASLSMPNLRDCWADGSKKKFAFEGSFWHAVDAMLEAFPTRSADRELLSSADYRMGLWRGDDFKAAALSTSVSAGILNVRHARMALENNGGKDYLVLTLVPSVEPVYQVEGLTLTVKGLALEDGEMLEPLQKSIEWEARVSNSKFSPSAAFTWVFPLQKGLKLRGIAGVEGAANIVVRRLAWAEVELPEDLNSAVKMNGNVTLKVLEREEERLKVQFEGKGSEPANFDDYYLRREAFQLLDTDGKRLDFNINSTSSGGGSGGWRNSYGGSIEGEPAKLKANLPGGTQKVDVKFDLFELPMPGSSLAE